MMLKKSIGFIIAALTLVGVNVQAQLLIETGGTPEEMAELLSGQGIQIINPQITCPTGGWGTYDADVPNFTSEEGLILATGQVTNALGPNTSESTTTNFGAPGNALLTAVSGFSTRDACMFEFDIIPQGDTLKFDFVFASEEYEEYVGTNFNDVFGFFISGPGIVGDPGLGNDKNIALIPGTNTAVTINNINNGNTDLNPDYPPTNPEFFNANPLNPNADIEYDGWTVNLQAVSQVTPCETYHLKLIIADATDNLWDSGVFIEKIESNNVQLSTITVGGTPNMIEGCNDGIITFTRQNVTSDPIDVEYYLQGTAINGVDYAQIGANPDPLVPKTITIPANQPSATLNVDPTDDGIDEGLEHILVLIGNPQCQNAISDSIRFNIQDSLEVYVNPPVSNICEGDQVTFNVDSGGTAFSWDPPTFLNDPNIKEPTAENVTENTTYILTTTLSECVATDTATVNTENVLIELDPENASCNGADDGAITSSISGGLPGYTYTWSGPNGYASSDPDISGLEPGTYTLVVVDQNDCQSSETVTITEPAVLSVSLDSPEFTGGFNLSCFGGNDGSIIATPSGGTAPFEFAWNDPDNQTSNNPTGLTAGTYSVTVTDANECETSANITLAEPSEVVVSISASQDVLCFGNNTGSATAQGNGGVGDYSYSWNTIPPQFNASATNLSAGTYTVTVTDDNNCTANTTITIDQPDAPITISTSKTNVACFGDATGSASANATGGTGDLTYQWNTIPVQTGQNATGLSAGTYMVTVTDENNCSQTASVTINQPNNPLGISVTNTMDVGCTGDASGSATVQATGGTPGYSYVWNTTPEQNGVTATNLSAGNYEVTVTDLNDCTESIIVAIDEPDDAISLSIDNQTNVNCFGDETGSVTVVAAGGTGSYTYSWNTTPTTNGPTLSGVEAGTYEVTVIDDNNCSDQLTVEITEPASPLEANMTGVQDVLCFGESTGEATVIASGGTPDYTYLWNDPLAQTTATATGLAAGSYSVTVTDDNGCTGIVNVTINQPATQLDASITNQENVDCFGNASGSATVQGTGGSGSYSYLWSPGGFNTSTVNNLLAGTYTVSVFDNNGCNIPTEVIVEITQPAEGLMADITSPTFTGGWNIACNGDATGSINLDVTGGSPPYEFTWFLANGDTLFTQNLTNLIAGTYTVVIADGGECTLEQSIELTQPDPIDYTFEMTPTLCFGSNDGELKVEIFGGTPGYDLSWQGPNGFTSTDTDLFNLNGGIYELTVTDTNGCTFFVPITVTQPEDLVITVDSLSQFTGGWNVSCHDSEDGWIDISASGGTTPYNYVWQGPNNPFFSTDQDVSDIPGGNYEVVLIDSNNCIQNLFIPMLTPDSIGIFLDAFQYPGGEELSCPDASDGSITSLVVGGTPGYSYNWSGPPGFPGAITENLDNLSEGTYVLEITDENGCINDEVVRIDPPDSLILGVSSPVYFGGWNISCTGAEDGSIELSVEGGVPGYTINWDGPDGFTSSNQNLSNLAAGLYCATVADTNACEEVICIELTEPAPLTGSLTSPVFDGGWNIDCNGNATGSISSSISGGTPPYFYFWDGPGFFTSDQANITDLVAGEYCLTVLDGNTCSFDTCIVLTEPDPILVSFDTSDFNGADVTCNNAEDGSITANVIGGTSGYSYEWEGPDGYTATGATINNIGAGIYCVTVTDANDCSETNCIAITEPEPITITLNTPAFGGNWNIDCNGNATGEINSFVDGGTPGYTYAWTGPDGFESDLINISGLVAGVYCLEITDENGCTTENCIELTQPDELSANAVVNPVACNSAATGSIDLNLSGGTPPYNISWSNDADTEIIDDLEAGVYSVVVIDENNCVFESTYEIEQPEDLELTLSSPTYIGGNNIDCFGASTGSIGNNIFGGTLPYTYSWTGPDGFTSSDSSLVGIAAGEYCLQVIDDNGCEASECITLTEPEVLGASINQTSQVSCFGVEDAAIEAIVIGGNASFSFAWTGPNGFTAIGQNISNLGVGLYCVTVTDINGCTAQSCITIGQPSMLSVTLDAPLNPGGFNISCYQGDDGAISATAVGGTLITSDYSYIWTGPDGFTADTQNIAGLIAGEYCVVVSDENGCVAEDCITLTEPEPLDVALSAIEYETGVNISCFNACDGEIDATVTGGAGPFTFEWQGPGGFTSSDTLISDLCAGTYILMTTDANDCVKIDSVELIEPEPIDIELLSPTYGGGANITCTGDSTGGIFTSITGGSPDYEFDWTGPEDFTSDLEILELIGAGTYYLSITDINGCVANDSIALTEPEDSLYATVDPFVYPGGTNISCHGVEDGSIDLTVYGGIAPYVFDWSGVFDFDSDEEDVFDLEAGQYSVIIVDTNECTYSINVELIEPDSALMLDLSSDPISCNSGSDGAIFADVSGGTPAYSYDWTGPNGFTSDEANITDLLTGEYIVSVSDTNGCSISDTLFLDQPTAIEIDGVVTDATCDASDGSISVSASGGTGTLSYEWNTGQNSPEIFDLSSGTYTVTITDENDCTAEATYEVGGVNPLELNLSSQDLLCHNDTTGELSAELLNATAPVEYSWTGPNGFESGDPLLMNLSAGTYTLTVVDGNNCSATATANVDQPDPLTLNDLFSPYPVSGIDYNISSPEGSDGSIFSLEISGGTPEYSADWNGPDGFEATGTSGLNGLEAGTYDVIVTDANGCTTMETITLTEPYELDLPNGISPNGDNINDALIIRGIELFPENELIVFNRWGGIVYTEDNYRNTTPWEGVNQNGTLLPDGTYFVVVKINSGEARELKGYLELRR